MRCNTPTKALLRLISVRYLEFVFAVKFLLETGRRSIAYSIRKAKEWNVNDAITFYYGDILNLGRGEQSFSRISMNENGSIKGSRSVMEPAMFDLIETTGVLHHMADPEKGLKSVTKVLKPGGILKLG